MLAQAHTFTIEGLRTRHVTVEVDIRRGLPAFTIVGLADTAVREARERVRTAILNSGYDFPARRITANLAPGDVPKAGPALDLALACAILASSDQIPRERLESHVMLGELGLDGEVRACRGTLAVAQATRHAGRSTLVLAGARAHEAQRVDGLQVAVAERLTSAVRILRGGRADPLPRRSASVSDPGSASVSDPGSTRGQDLHGAHRCAVGPDLGDVRGQHHAVRALVIAAAGGHNSLLSGPPGTGKTMLAQRLPSILPALSEPEALEVARIHSVAGAASRKPADRPPFRAPHHSITTAGLVGGAQRGRVGEIVLAHNGVLFLDELSEFARPTLQALRQPLEEGRIAIVRARHSAIHPSRFLLVAATNPCPCGYAGVGERCRCTETERSRHRRRLSGPLLERIDLLAHLSPDAARGLSTPALTSSKQAREQVLAARERQAVRLREDDVSVNAQMDARTLQRHVKLGRRDEEMLRSARERGLLSTRGEHRVLRVARTLADLRGHDRLGAREIGEAIALRPDASLAGDRAA